MTTAPGWTLQSCMNSSVLSADTVEHGVLSPGALHDWPSETPSAGPSPCDQTRISCAISMAFRLQPERPDPYDLALRPRASFRDLPPRRVARLPNPPADQTQIRRICSSQLALPP